MISIPQAFYYETLDSTMDEAKRLIQSGKVKNIAYVVSDYQTDGRGTRGRIWSSPKNSGIYLSIIHLPENNNYFETTSMYTLACGIACVEAIYEVCNIETKIKPVNDIYVNEKKLGGILVESKLYQSGIASLVTGIGINTHKEEHNLDRIPATPISLQEILSQNTFQNFSKKDLIEKIVLKVCFWYKEIFNNKQDIVQSTWEKCLQ